MRYKIINRKKFYLTVIADIIGSIVFMPWRLLGRHKEIVPEAIREILVIRTAYIGDAMMTVPILKPLKSRFRNARVSFLTSTAASELLQTNPYIDEVITHDPFWFYPSKKKAYFEFIKKLKEKPFDLVIETRGDIRELLFLVWPLKAGIKVSYNTGGGGYFLTHTVPYDRVKHKVEYHLDIIRYLGCGDKTEWSVYLSAQEKDRVRRLLDEKGIRKPFAAIHPGARVPLKRWMPERFTSLCNKIANSYKWPVVLLGSGEEKEIASEIAGKMEHNAVSLAGELTLRELAVVLSEAALFICNDSSPMHIAAAMKTPTVAIFGPSKSRETAPYGNFHRVVEKDFPCRHTCDENTCRYEPYNACMKAIEVTDVMAKVDELREEQRK